MAYGPKPLSYFSVNKRNRCTQRFIDGEETEVRCGSGAVTQDSQGSSGKDRGLGHRERD